MNTLKERILTIIEKNSRINIAELAVMLGTEEIEIANALQELEEDGHRKSNRPDRGARHAAAGQRL